MVAWNYGPTWAARTRAYARNSVRPITGTIIEERATSLHIRTATRPSVWVPKALVHYDKDKGVFTMPSWLASDRLLD